MSLELPKPATVADVVATVPVAVPVPAPVPVAEDVPARPMWNQVAPAAPWCPPHWEEHLEQCAPGLFASGSAASPHDVTGGRFTADGWQLITSSRRGRLHAHRGEHREDAGHLLHFADGWCAAVADGAGSATYSRLGSALASHVVTHALRDALKHGHAPREALGPAMRQAAQRVHDVMRDFAQRTGLAWRDLRTTLLVAALHHDQLAVMQVGDGAMIVQHTDGTLTHPQAVATGDYSGEVAHFLPDDGALDVLQSSLVSIKGDRVRTVLLATDGVEDPWYPFARHASALLWALEFGDRGSEGGAPVLPPGVIATWPTTVLNAADPVHALGEWLTFEKRGENDDRTLCVAQRIDAALTAVL